MRALKITLRFVGEEGGFIISFMKKPQITPRDDCPDILFPKFCMRASSHAFHQNPLMLPNMSAFLYLMIVKPCVTVILI